MLLSKKEQDKHQVEHYSNILNQPSPSTVYDFANIAQPEEPDVSMEPITITEVQNTIQLLKNGKPPRLDQISAEFLKYDGDFGARAHCG